MKNILLLIAATFFFSMNSCKSEGCTDPRASNFSYEADKDDGSCEYLGCTDPDALNYDPDAKTDNGNCIYKGGLHITTIRNSVGVNNVFLAVEINQGFIGDLAQTCTTPFPNCETACAHLKFTEQNSGTYILQFWEVRQTASMVFDTLFTSQSIPVQVIGKECSVFEIK